MSMMLMLFIGSLMLQSVDVVCRNEFFDVTFILVKTVKLGSSCQGFYE
jgi:hypothetical protein